MRRAPLVSSLACGLLSLTVMAAPSLAAPAVHAHDDAQDDVVAGLGLPIGAEDVSTSDDDLADTDREVVVITTAGGTPTVTKLRAETERDARVLVDELRAVPGVTAAANVSVTVPEGPEPEGSEPAGSEPAGSEPAGSEPAGSEPAGSEDGDTAVDAADVAGHGPTIGSEPLGAQQWALPAIGAEAAWRYARGKGVTVAVIDTGVDRTHPDLAGRTAAQIDVPLDGRSGDVRGHGTHVAGIVGAALNGVGIAGLANQATVLPVRVFGASGSADSYTIATGIYRAMDRGAAVMNLSLTSPQATAVEKKAVADAVARGITVVAAAGNTYDEGNQPQYPAAYPGVLGVTSVDRAGERSWFANTGGHVDLAAPGEDILSTVPGGGYELMDGTSMAAPFVSAAAALVRAANPTWGAAAVRDALTGTAQDDASGNGWDTTFGAGRLRADRATSRAALAPGGVGQIATPTPTPTPTQPTPKPTQPTPKPARPIAVRAQVARSGFGNVLAVNIDPDRGGGSYAFVVQRAKAGGGWADLPKTYRTQGATENRLITLARGTYRVSVRSDGRYAAAVSKAVELTDPTVRVSLTRDRTGNKLAVDVDPNASGRWTFRVQRQSGKSWVTLRGSYRTAGKAQSKRVNLKRGTYRVVVEAAHGYRGAVSGVVTLRK